MSNFPNNIICSTSTISDGNMGFRFGEQNTVLTNRRKFLSKYNLDYTNCIPMKSDHGDLIKIVGFETKGRGAPSREEAIEADVLVTQEKNLPLLLTTADCLPVSFYDPVTKTIALAHISRHTLALMLPKKTIGFFGEHLGINPEDLIVQIGPHIKKESYRFPLPFKTISPALAPFITEDNGYGYIDTTSACISQLTGAGVCEESISISEIDTATSPRHFSYYRAVHENIEDKRLATILSIKNSSDV